MCTEKSLIPEILERRARHTRPLRTGELPEAAFLQMPVLEQGLQARQMAGRHSPGLLALLEDPFLAPVTESFGDHLVDGVEVGDAARLRESGCPSARSGRSSM